MDNNNIKNVLNNTFIIFVIYIVFKFECKNTKNFPNDKANPSKKNHKSEFFF